MKIAINIYPLRSGHKNRGIGFYTKNLVESLKKDPEINVQEFTNVSEVKDADLIHYPWFDLFFRSLFIKKNIPTVVTIHDVIPLKFNAHYPIGIKAKINLYLQKLALKKSSIIITDSKISKSDIEKFLKINPDKIEVIALAQDKDFRILSQPSLMLAKRQYQLPDQFLLYVGDANFTKNLPFLIKAFKDLITLPKLNDLKLVLVGEAFLKNVEEINHPELESLKMVNRLIKEGNLEKNILRMGKIEKSDLIALYNLATIYVQPSIYEGFGLPVLEAMACGAPVVCSSAGSLKEVGGEAAVYFDPENSEQFKSIIKEVLENRSLQSKLSNLSLKQASRFSLEKMILQTKLVYSKILK